MPNVHFNEQIVARYDATTAWGAECSQSCEVAGTAIPTTTSFATERINEDRGAPVSTTYAVMETRGPGGCPGQV